MLEFELKDRKISTSRNAFVVGIINANNDSFWKKSRGGFSLAKKLIEQGADILDIGAESSRPGAEYISENDELINILRKLNNNYEIAKLHICSLEKVNDIIPYNIVIIERRR